MSNRNSQSQQNIYLVERKVIEPEINCRKHFVKRPQSGRQIDEAKFRLRKCKRVQKLRTQNLKVPQVPDIISNLVNILQHENFLKVVDRYFGATVKNQSRKPLRPNKPKNSICKSTVPNPTELNCDTL